MTYTLLSKKEEKDGRMLLTVSVRDAEEKEKRVRFYAAPEDYIEASEPCEGEALFSEDYCILRRAADRQAAYDRALRILEAGDNGSRGLFRKLREKGFSAEAADYAVEKLREAGLLDDAALLCRWVTDAVTRKLYGKRRLLTYFAAKGFKGDEIREAIAACESDGSIDFNEAKRALFARFSPATPEEGRKLLYKYGF